MLERTLIYHSAAADVFSKLIFEPMKRVTGVILFWIVAMQLSAQSSFMASQRQFPKVANALKMREDSLKKTTGRYAYLLAGKTDLCKKF